MVTCRDPWGSRPIARVLVAAWLWHFKICVSETPLAPSSLRSWLNSQRLPIPGGELHPGMHLLGGVTKLELDGGNCTHLTVDQIHARGVEKKPEVAITITGVGTQCDLLTTRPYLFVNFSVVNSTIVLKVEIQNRKLPDGQKAPLGAIKMKKCNAELKFGHHHISGDIITETLRRWLVDLRNGLVSTIVCQMLTATVDHWGTTAMMKIAGKADGVIAKDANTVTPEPTAPLVDWGTFPPALFFAGLLRERLDKIMKTDTVSKILQFGGKRGVLTLGEAAGFQVGSVDTGGAVNADIPNLEVYGAGPHLGVKAIMRSARLTADVGLLLRPISTWLKFGHYNETEKTEEALADGEIFLNDKVPVQLDLGDFELDAQVRGMVSRKALDNLEVDQLQNLHCIGETAVTSATPGNRAVSLRKFDVSVKPVAFQAGAAGTLESQVFGALYTSLFQLMGDSMPAMASIVQSGMDLAIENYLGKLDACGSSSVYYGMHRFTIVSYWAAILLSLAGISAALWACLFPRSRLGHMKHFEPLDEDSLSGDGFDSRQYAFDDEDEDCCSNCLACHPLVPRPLAVSYPCFCVAAIFLFIYADFSLGTTLEVTFYGAGETTTIGPIFTFSLISIIRDTYKAKAYLFSFLAGVMSGIWPVAKLVLLLIAWLTPSCCLSARCRGYIVTFLDQYGKFSLVDIWLGIIGLASYNIHWEGKDSAIKVRPVVLDGFFMFIVGTAGSLVLGHIAAIYHQRTVPDEDVDSRATSGSDGWDEYDENRCSCCCACTGITVQLCTIVLILLGVFVTSFCMVISGVAADVLTDPEDRTQWFSLISLGQSVAAADRSSWALQMLPYFMYLHTVYIPLVLCIILIVFEIVRNFMPTRRRLANQVLTMCRILDAWSALDVFAVAVFVSSLEIGLFARYLVYYDNISTGCLWLKEKMDLDCMGADCHLAKGYPFLLIAGILSYSVPKYIFFTVGAGRQRSSGSIIGQKYAATDDSDEGDE